MQVIKDYSQTLYSAGFVPAAHVYFSSSAEPGQPVLQDSVLGGITQAPPRQLSSHAVKSDSTAAGDQNASMGADRPDRGPNGRQADQTKKPKWLKMGK